MLTGQGNPGKHLSVGQLQFLQPYLSAQVHGRLLLWALSETAAKLTSCRAAVPPWRLCRVWLRPGLTGMLVRCMLRGAGFVISAPMHKRKHSPTQLPDHLGYRLHRECNAVPSGTFVSGKLSRCPPPAAWRLSQWVAECAGVGRTQIGATYRGVLFLFTSPLQATTDAVITASECPPCFI